MAELQQPQPHAQESTSHSPSGTGESIPEYRWKVVVSTSIANALEWFDFVVYGFFAVVMAKLFFPASNDFTALLAIFATFAIPFAFRPIGAIVLGAYADRHGRKKTLLLSIALMTSGTAIMAVVPTYSSIGAWAAVIVIAARVLQAFSVGGEYGAAVAFLVEQDDARRGFLASWHYSSQSMTAVLATGLATLLSVTLTPEQVESWGWRVPFLFGLLIAPVGMYVRSQLRETDQFMAAQPSKAPVLEVLANYRSHVALSACAIAVSAVTVYMVVFMPTFAIRQLHLPSSVAFLGSLLAGAIHVVLIPIVGLLSDRYDRITLSLVAALAVLILAYPLFAFLVSVPSVPALLAVQGVLGVLNAINLGCLGALVAGLFPTRLRTSGLSLANAFTQMIIGGTTPFVSLWLIEATGLPTAPAFYLMFGAMPSVAALAVLSRKRRLTDGHAQDISGAYGKARQLRADPLIWPRNVGCGDRI
jgi:MFS transporter, MHS family, proline/betaine transporter